MVEVTTGIGSGLISIYKDFISTIPHPFNEFINILTLVLLIVVYSIFVWKFYRFISKKNPLGLNLNQYNNVQNDFFSRLTKSALYLVEYILVLPFLIFVIFGIFTFFLIILAQTQETSQILIISAAIIAAIRMTAYYKEGLSQEISKMLPFTLLAITILNPNNFSDIQYIERVVNHLSNLPAFIGQIFTYLLFIVGIEAILRFIDFIFSLFGLEEQDETSEEN